MSALINLAWTCLLPVPEHGAFSGHEPLQGWICPPESSCLPGQAAHPNDLISLVKTSSSHCKARRDSLHQPSSRGVLVWSTPTRLEYSSINVLRSSNGVRSRRFGFRNALVLRQGCSSPLSGNISITPDPPALAQAPVGVVAPAHSQTDTTE
ncbi:hypothetical protein T310_9514 [Rasamsonia emersonii CBS 393.64]|uniref:Uncharacterized protein n=1 Tax=Rasamsonia emersonii (strain ATCC 16479 / CBS 393.64 / IMI 116815) TaxID=1408163 RepID=A0A0F4YFI1_RASE3|nr:hypothetical protein T310_9514 [Rasamsonia emersonii CBS 393.64]KKA16900.1 hypothetical protein T310_9514 [Rasamsonia emersonii CBS 393.64]